MDVLQSSNSHDARQPILSHVVWPITNDPKLEKLHRLLCYTYDSEELNLTTLNFSLEQAIKRFSWWSTTPTPSSLTYASNSNNLLKSGKARTSAPNECYLIVRKHI